MLAENFARSAETLSPHLVADERDLRAMRHVVGICEIAAELGRDAEHLQEIRGNPSASDPFRGRAPFFAGKIVGLAAEKDQVGEGMLGSAPIEIVQVTDRAAGKGGRLLADINEPFGMRIGQRAEQDGIDHAEDGNVRADTESESEDRERREARLFRDHSECVANVGQQGLHGIVRVKKSRSSSFRAQRDDGIDASRAPRRQPRGDERDHRN